MAVEIAADCQVFATVVVEVGIVLQLDWAEELDLPSMMLSTVWLEYMEYFGYSYVG